MTDVLPDRPDHPRPTGPGTTVHRGPHRKHLHRRHPSPTTSSAPSSTWSSTHPPPRTPSPCGSSTSAPAKRRDRLLTHVAEGNRAKTATAPVVAVLAADTNFHEFLATRLPDPPRDARTTSPPTPAARDGMARFNATLQIGYFLLAVRAAGLAAGPMGGFDAAGVDTRVLRRQHGWKLPARGQHRQARPRRLAPPPAPPRLRRRRPARLTTHAPAPTAAGRPAPPPLAPPTGRAPARHQRHHHHQQHHPHEPGAPPQRHPRPQRRPRDVAHRHRPRPAATTRARSPRTPPAPPGSSPR